MSTSAGSVTGLVYVGGVPSGAAAANAIVFLHSDTDGTCPTTVVPPGYAAYTIANVPPGKWRAYLRPDPSSGYALATHGASVGTANGTKFDVVSGAETSGIDFVTRPAGFVQVTVTDAAGQALAGATVLVQNTNKSLAGLPTPTLTNGVAYIGNVPLKYKLCVIGPPGFQTVWYPGASTFKGGKALSLPVLGANAALTVSLPPNASGATSP